jgi:dipeptidyl aminopeptidase/acylaminoacyl peptidase
VKLKTILVLVVGLILRHPAVAVDKPLALLTVAERSDYRATARHAEVVEFCQKLAQLSPLVRLGELGATFEGRKLPLLIIADPPIATAEEAAKTNKLVIYAQGNIHAGEVDGKEALLMLARELALAKERPLLKNLIIVIAPIFNADGNEKMSKTNRPGQVGPEEGMGMRVNGQGLDLNRDFIKLDSPEVRALVRFLNQWNPAIVIDTHTTNGSRHRYTITYEGPSHPACNAKMLSMVRENLFPDLTKRLEKKSGYRSYYYGNFSRDRTRWETVPPTPRYGTHYVSMRNRIGILCESYSYAPYKDRILASRDFVASILEYAAANKEALQKLLIEAREATVKAGSEPIPAGTVAVRQKPAPFPAPVTILGFEEGNQDGQQGSANKSKDYQVSYMGLSEPVVSVSRPYAYLIPKAYASAVEALQRHGVELKELREDIDLDVEIYQVEKVLSRGAYQNHRPVSVEARPRSENRRIDAGTILVKTGQALGTLAIYLLEPQSEDGLCTWNYFDEDLKEGQDYAVLRLPAAPPPLLLGNVRPLPEDCTAKKAVTYSKFGGGPDAPDFGGAPTSGLTWLADGEHFFQRKDGQQLKVHALTGKSQPHEDFDRQKVAQALSTIPTIKPETARSLAAQAEQHMDADRRGAFFEHEDDLYYCRLDGAKAVRLTRTPGAKELASFSPNGQFVAFVRTNNLYVVDVETQTERALTTDGTTILSNGKADWVYFEEIFNRNWQAYWWSPDSRSIAFLRFDDSPVHKFTVIDHLPIRLVVESTPYPKAGDPNPIVKLGIVSVAGGAAQFPELGNYSHSASLIIRVGWTPESKHVYCCVQDRAQTWLDFCMVDAGRSRDPARESYGNEFKRLFRDTTKAWVEDPGAPHFLKDGSFLLASERSGWKHFYHLDKNGKLLGPVTSGPWEARDLHLVDEAGGWVYFSGTRDSPIASNLYRIKLDGTNLERLTTEAGDHQVNLSPKGNLFIDKWSNHRSPTQVALFHTGGPRARTLDANPVYALDEYNLGKCELVQIKTADGFVLEGSLLKPADFDAKRKYPVWFMTYGGPHFPIIHDTWSGGRVHDQALASLGFVIFRCDPRSASGKGAVSTWTAYRQLGIQELKDIETAIGWLKSHPWVDGTRIGMSGHSYGGFMTAFAMTHSNLFASGIAGAPVTDWRNYDTIYTERYMNTPQENPEGYNATSVVKAASKLHGKILILHGLMDDNVHVQNSVQLIQELQRAEKDFEMMFYPRSRHGIHGTHYQRVMVEFMKQNLLATQTLER